MATDIPLKTIINKSKKINKMRAKQNRSGKGKKSGGRSASRSRGRSQGKNGSPSNSTNYSSANKNRGMKSPSGRSKSRRKGNNGRSGSKPGRSRSARRGGRPGDREGLGSLLTLKTDGRGKSRGRSRTGSKRPHGHRHGGHGGNGGRSRSKSRGLSKRQNLMKDIAPGMFQPKREPTDIRLASKSPRRHHCDASYPEIIALNPMVVMPLRDKSSSKKLSKKFKGITKESARNRRKRLYNNNDVRKSLERNETSKRTKRAKGLIYNDVKSPRSKRAQRSMSKSRSRSHSKNDVGNFYMHQSFQNLKKSNNGINHAFSRVEIGEMA